MTGRGERPCAAIMRADPEAADRMWFTVTDEAGREVADKRMRARGMAVCSRCPFRSACLADALTGGWKDSSIVGGLDYPRRGARLARRAPGLADAARRLRDERLASTQARPARPRGPQGRRRAGLFAHARAAAEGHDPGQPVLTPDINQAIKQAIRQAILLASNQS